MNTDETRISELIHSETTREIIGAAFEVHNTLGFGFLEKVHQRALQAELLSRKRQVEIELPMRVSYKGITVGEHFADLFVDGCVMVEVKVAAQYNPAAEAQLLNELKATGTKVGLLINFAGIVSTTKE